MIGTLPLEHSKTRTHAALAELLRLLLMGKLQVILLLLDKFHVVIWPIVQLKRREPILDQLRAIAIICRGLCLSLDRNSSRGRVRSQW